jgi:hypothetical protein
VEQFSKVPKVEPGSVQFKISAFRTYTMSKRKIDVLGGISSSNDSKKVKHDVSKSTNLKKTPNLLVDSDSESGSEDESEVGGGLLEEQGFKINEDYAKRFEHNKKREELHRRRLPRLFAPRTSTDFDSGGKIPKGAKII